MTIDVMCVAAGALSLEAAAKLLHEATGITEMPENCDGLAACLNAATDGLVKIATGQVVHVYRGLCPDAVTGFDSRDSDCPACKILQEIQQ